MDFKTNIKANFEKVIHNNITAVTKGAFGRTVNGYERPDLKVPSGRADIAIKYLTPTISALPEGTFRSGLLYHLLS